MRNARKKIMAVGALLVVCLMVFCCCGAPGEASPQNGTGQVTMSQPGDAGAAAKNAEPQEEDVQDAAAQPGVMQALQSVIAGETEFFETGLEKKLNIADLRQAVSTDSEVTVEVEDFTVMDLDGDGSGEVVLWLSVNGNEYYGCEVLHEEDQQVYGYCIPYRAFNSLKEDKTFTFSSGAGNTGIGIMKFDKTVYEIEKIVLSEVSYDEDNNPSVGFHVKGKQASQQDFNAEMEKQNEKKDAVRYGFTDQNVEAYIR